MTGTAAAYAANDAPSGTSYSGVFRYSRATESAIDGNQGYFCAIASFNGSNGFSGSLLSKVVYAIINLYSFWQSYCSE